MIRSLADRVPLFAAGLAIGVFLTTALGAAFGMLLLGGGAKGLEGAIGISLLAHAAIAIAFALRSVSFGVGYFCGPALLFAWFKFQQWNREIGEDRQRDALRAFASTEPPNFSREHNIIALIGLYHVYSLDTLPQWFGLTKQFTVQLFPEGKSPVAYRAASGSACLEPRNIRTTLELLNRHQYSGEANAPCLDEVAVDTDSDAIIVWDNHGNKPQALKLGLPLDIAPPSVALSALIAERIGGRSRVLTKLVSVKDPTSQVRGSIVHPRDDQCPGWDARQVAVCIATGITPPTASQSPAQAHRIFAVATPFVDSQDADIKRLARTLVEGAEKALKPQ